MTATVIFWFRRDLRLSDNAALCEAAKHGHVLPVYILDERQEFTIGGASKWWLHHSLSELNKALDGKLLFFSGDSTRIIPQLAKETKAQGVYWNNCYEPAFAASDDQVEQRLKEEDVRCGRFDGTLLWTPNELLKDDGTPYKVYAPFLRLIQASDEPHKPISKPKALTLAPAKPKGAIALNKLHLLPAIPWDAGIDKAWEPGEAAAKAMLRSFVKGKLEHYGAERNFPARDVLSRLSPYLHYGDISPNQLWHAVHDADKNMKKEDGNVQKFISELCWRDFSYNILYHFPETITESYNARLKKLKWKYDKELLRKWQTGQTGIPIVDAGMRQLWQTGYMHNRVRMITASFLIKNLLIDWRTGADWFLDCLVDADLAVNTMNWQWVAGSGLDSAPFFRVFNPVLQSRKFDGEGAYIKTFVPELKELPARYVHEPWKAPAKVLAKASVEIGKVYPAPCVDLKASAAAALEAYRKTA